MKKCISTIIIGNWVLSWLGLTMESVNGTVWGTLIGVAWFVCSSLILIKADKKGILINKTK